MKRKAESVERVKRAATPSAGFDSVALAVAVINESQGLGETVEGLLDSAVYDQSRVVIVLSDGRKFTVAWSALGPEGLKRSEPPETTLKV